MALFNFPKIQLFKKVYFRGLMMDVSSFLMKTNLSIANLKEFQILLQKFL